MPRLCPYKKQTKTKIEYGTSWPKSEKASEVRKEISFGLCDQSSCMAYDGGVCLLMEGNK